MFHVVLYQPEIPPNTGNVIRLCANTGCTLHLVKPLGFRLDEPRLRRAGLDYREWTTVREHASLDAFETGHAPRRTFAFSVRGETPYCDISFRAGDALLFGPETRGLPDAVLSRYPREHRLRIPMRPSSRSLNLSNAVAVACYEAWRQLAFNEQHRSGDPAAN